MRVLVDVVIRKVVRSDLPAVVLLLADDPLGMSREDTSAANRSRYEAALEAIDRDDN